MVSKRKSSKKSKRSKSRSPQKSAGSAKGYCLRCRTKRTMTNPKKRTTRNHRTMMCGQCSSCGTKMCRFI